MPPDLETWYARPVFFVSDCEASLRFYRDLGFRPSWRHEVDGRLIAVQVNRNDAELILNENPRRAGGGRISVTLYPGQVARCAEAFAAAGVEARDDHWGMPVKVVTDPDGNDLVLFDDEMAET